MRRNVDAAGERRHDDAVAPAQLRRQVAGETPTVGRAASAKNHSFKVMLIIR
jgi:hypothetical protein